MKTFLPFLVAVALAVGGIAVGRKMLTQRSAAAEKGQVLRVIVAKEDLSPGYQLQKSDLRETDLPVEATPPAAIRDIEKLVGRVIAVPVSKGQTIVEPALASADAGLGLQALVPAGMRAATIEVNEYSGMTGQLIPGCRVDVLATLVDEKDRQSVARTIVENVPVIAVGASTSAKDVSARQSGEGLATVERVATKSVTLMVTPKQAEAIELASTKGRPRLVMRGGQDNAPVGSAGITIGELTGSRPGPASAQGNAIFAEFFKSMQSRAVTAPTRPTTRKADLASAKIIEPVVPRRSVQLIKGGKETTKQLDVDAALQTRGTNPPVDGSAQQAGN